MITFSHINKSNCFSNSPFKIFHTAFIFKIRCKGWPVKAMQQLLQYPLIRYRFRQSINIFRYTFICLHKPFMVIIK